MTCNTAANGEQYIHRDLLLAGSATDTGGVIRLARTVLHWEVMGTNAPVIILITNGESIDLPITMVAMVEMRFCLHGRSLRIIIGTDEANLKEPENFPSVGMCGRRANFGGTCCFSLKLTSRILLNPRSRS